MKTAMWLLGMLLVIGFLAPKPSDKYVRNRIPMIANRTGRCSAVQVKAPSGKSYLVSAGHCDVDFTEGTTTAILGGRAHHDQIKLIKVSPDSDLLVAEGIPGLLESISQPAEKSSIMSGSSGTQRVSIRSRLKEN